MDPSMLSGLLLATMSPNPDEIKRAEVQLKLLKQTPGFAFLLLTLCSPSLSSPASSLSVEDKRALNVAQSAAICFKNFVHLNWDTALSRERDLSPECEIQPQERVQIKQGIVDFMCKVHPNVQKQLGEAVRVIAQSDWPAQWLELIPQLNAKLLDPNTPFPVLLGCLSTLNELFKRFRDVQATVPVMLEVKAALEACQEQITVIFMRLVGMLSTHKSEEENVLACLRLVLRIFYSLNWLTIPEFFEDHIQQWMGEGHAFLLALPAPAASSTYQNRETPTMHERVLAATLENIRLYAEKYVEEVSAYIKPFLQQTFGMLVGYSESTMPRHSELLISGMRFVAVCINQPFNRQLFEDTNTLQAILQRIVLPNLTLSQVDLETFKDNPMEYLQRDMQGSDFETRRRAASELVDKLCKQFVPVAQELCQSFVAQLLANNGGNWQARDVAINLMIAIMVDTQTAREGATKVKNEQAMHEFMRQHLSFDSTQQQQSPIIVADTIKYIAVFRQFLPKDYVLSVLFPFLMGNLEDKQVCIHTYAASAIDGFLSIRTPGKQFTRQEVAPFVQPILVRLFNLIDQAEENYNEHVMKTVLRVINVARMDVGAVVPGILSKLGAVLTRVANNPSNPTFNHLLFETISALIRFGVESQQCTVQQLEAVVNPAFERILQMFIVEFVPYVLQIMAQTLRMRPVTDPLPQQYLGIFPGLFSPTLWQIRANVPALVIFLQAFMMRQPGLFNDNRVVELVNIVEKLVSVKSTEEFGFDLAKCVVANLPGAQQPAVSKIFGAGFMRFGKGQTPMLTRQLVLFTCVVVGKRGAAFAQTSCDGFGPGTFERFVSQMLVPALPTSLTQSSHKRVGIIGLTRLVVEFSASGFANQDSWNAVACGLCQLVVGGNTAVGGGASAGISSEAQVNESLEHMAEGMGTHQFAKLSFSLEEQHDDYFKSEVPDAVTYSVQTLARSQLVNRALQALASHNLQQVAEQFQALASRAV
ncbi:hypothetical protein BASA81_001735 [Batrachochytrium salamandrivorans]|nr:hypothetical protein BASA81_001735 [Batrachochytrium salamandrivorans]